MNSPSGTPRAVPSLFAHLSLGMAGLCLGVAELDFLPEIPFILLFYLFFLGVSWRQGGRWILPWWAANGLALLITVAVAAWVAYLFQGDDTQTWLRDVPLPAALIPYLGPVLMGLLLVRLFRPRTSDDFWLLQGVGLLQVALGCVLAHGTAFGLLLLLYAVTALCTLASYEGQRQAVRSASVGDEPAARAGRGVGMGWLLFSLRWAGATAALAFPLFLFTPRLDAPDWEPLGRFGVRSAQPASPKMGFSEEIDLTRGGALESDDSVAFTVRVTDPSGKPVNTLLPGQRWRGAVLDRYDDGIWRGELTFAARGPGQRIPVRPKDPGAGELHLEFRVPGKTGGVFLADPVVLGPKAGLLPLWPGPEGTPRKAFPRFFETEGNVTYVYSRLQKEYVYNQAIDPKAGHGRYPAYRTTDAYLTRLIRFRVRDLRTWTHQLLDRLAARPGFTNLRRTIQQHQAPGATLPPEAWGPVARMLSDHLAKSGEYGYSLVMRREMRSLDPVFDFLVNVKEGPCERYAAALALMLRTQGIPARIVRGYRGVEPQGNGLYHVLENQAHAWVEAYVPAEEGGQTPFEWLVLDPTPGTESAGTSALARWWRDQQRTGQSFWQEMILGYNARQQEDLWKELGSGKAFLRLASFLLVAAVAFVTLTLARRVWKRQRRVTLGKLYQRLVDLLEQRLHLRLRPDQTPRELARDAQAVLAARPGTATLAGVPGRLVEVLYRQRFGQEEVPAAEWQLLQQQVDQLAAALA